LYPALLLAFLLLQWLECSLASLTQLPLPWAQPSQVAGLPLPFAGTTALLGPLLEFNPHG
jgi:hypothetical protein